MKYLMLLFLMSVGLSAEAQRPDSAAFVNLSESQFTTWLKQQSVPVLVHYKADWCVVCKRQEPMLDSLQTMHRKDLLVLGIDLDKNPLLGQYYEIDALPVFMMYSKGTMIWSKVGAVSIKEIEEVLHVVQHKKH